jgi:anionic cell wall polymer biosynthesis LytR-Cps2A-Psr (LCP) family protein
MQVTMSDAEERAAQLAASPYHAKDDATDNGNGTSRKGKRRGRARRSHTVAKVLLSSVLVLGLVTGLGVTFLYRHLNGNLNVEDLGAQLGTDRPEEVEVEGPKDPMNILVMGSDTREGEGNKIDGEAAGPGLSDTTIMIHLSADRQTAYGVSIPRDSLVDRPDCIDEDGETIPGATGVMWNAAFAVGGPACTIRQF